MSNVIKKVLVLVLTIVLCTVVFEGTSTASQPEDMKLLPEHTQNVRLSLSQERSDRAKIISVLESRIGSHHLPEQAREKLATMHEGELRLVAMLCDRIATANDRAGTDLALLLATALIVLS